MGSRLRKLAESVSARKPPDVLAGLRGTLVRDEIGQDQVTSRTGTGFCNPGPVDNAVAWCALWGISQLPSTPRVGRRAVTISSGHLGRPRQEWSTSPTGNNHGAPLDCGPSCPQADSGLLHG